MHCVTSVQIITVVKYTRAFRSVVIDWMLHLKQATASRWIAMYRPERVAFCQAYTHTRTHKHTYLVVKFVCKCTRNHELTTLIEHLSKRLHYSTWILNVVRSARMADSMYKTTELDFSDCHKWFLEPCRLNVSISFLYSDINGANGLNWKW